MSELQQDKLSTQTESTGNVNLVYLSYEQNQHTCTISPSTVRRPLLPFTSCSVVCKDGGQRRALACSISPSLQTTGELLKNLVSFVTQM